MFLQVLNYRISVLLRHVSSQPEFGGGPVESTVSILHDKFICRQILRKVLWLVRIVSVGTEILGQSINLGQNLVLTVCKSNCGTSFKIVEYQWGRNELPYQLNHSLCI